MKIKIGGAEFAASRPKDLNEQLIASTGCDAGEIGGMIAGRPLADLVGRALAPFIPADGRPDPVALADMIGAAGVADVAAQVAGLYAADAPAAEPAPKTPAKPDATA